MKLSLSTTLVSLAAAAFVPAQAEPLAVGPHGVQASTQSIAAPEAPIAAFERLLAARAPGVRTPTARLAVDPLDAPFHAALWSPAAPSKLATGSGPHHAEVPQ